MNDEAAAFWRRAERTLHSARQIAQHDPDNAAGMAYYAAFYAVSALFAQDGRFFRKHTELETAVHRDLVKAGKWNIELGQCFSRLAELRDTGHYGVMEHVAPDQSHEALDWADRILHAVRPMVT